MGIVGTGCHVPSDIVTNADLVRTLDTTDEWITSRTGIRERRWLEDGRTTSDMCVAAARQALENSGRAATDIDAIIVATFTYDQPLPSTALIVKEALGAANAFPLDLGQAACAGGVYGMLTAAHLLQNERLHNVLVIGAECLSRVTDPEERSTRVFFGDAAGAVVMSRTEPGHGLLSWDLDASLSHAVEIPSGGASLPTTAETVGRRQHFLKMDGRAVWVEATKRLPESIRATLDRAGLDPTAVDHYVLHQANLNIVHEAMDVLGVDRTRAGVTVDKYGNTGAATVFTVLHQAMERGEINRGDLLVISGIGAGFIWGTLCLRAG
ncbi:3-oxoacyl-ACP synthase III family protein [Peterkaempfera bronchialis]|uniref:3-oxoacyl-ACP synthase III family protein n=1 Tax=Peterkaempfera bronchialis TaxID=2126346 RepID=UPI001E569E42|nr:beta-ketoacyl-ACP synthase III [Peterkaempfera bronchialis]